MRHRYITWLCVLLAPLAAGGCGIDVHYVPTNTPPRAMSPRPAAQVEIFASARPTRPFKEVGLIEVQQEGANYDDTAEIIARLREEAGLRGCDALVMLGANDATQVSGAVGQSGGFVSSRTLKGYRASCIVYTSGAGTAPVEGKLVPVSSDAKALQDLVLRGINPAFHDECRAGPVWAVVDDATAGARIDAILDDLSTKPSRTAREAVCVHTLAAARLIRMVRTKALNLPAELGHRAPAARAVALRYVALTRDSAHLPVVRERLGDPDAGVQREAFDAVIAFQDRDAIPVLRKMVGAESSKPHPRACSALWALGEKDACGGEKSSVAGGVVGGMMSGQAKDFCAEAKANVASADDKQRIRGLLFFVGDAFGRFEQPFNTFLRDSTPRSSCSIEPRVREDLLRTKTTAPTVRALAAATALWDMHPAVVPSAPEAQVQSSTAR